jgi:sugar/nucleoside kinase (ribokinase family)
VGQVGTDAYAPMLRSALNECGVDTSKLTEVDGSSGIAFIMLQPGGENSIVLVGGANTSEEWQVRICIGFRSVWVIFFFSSRFLWYVMGRVWQAHVLRLFVHSYIYI